jgi:hypothetical protein
MTEVKDREEDPNIKNANNNWQFSTKDARIKLRKHYTSFCDCRNSRTVGSTICDAENTWSRPRQLADGQ